MQIAVKYITPCYSRIAIRGKGSYNDAREVARLPYVSFCDPSRSDELVDEWVDDSRGDGLRQLDHVNDEELLPRQLGVLDLSVVHVFIVRRGLAFSRGRRAMRFGG